MSCDKVRSNSWQHRITRLRSQSDSEIDVDFVDDVDDVSDEIEEEGVRGARWSTACRAARLAAAFPRPLPIEPLSTRLRLLPPRPCPCFRRPALALASAAAAAISSGFTTSAGRCTTTESSLATDNAAANASRHDTELKLFPIKSITSKYSKRFATRDY